MRVITVTSDRGFQGLLTSTKNLLVADFSASWCGPCLRIAPIYEHLAVKYPVAVFVKLDVDVCQETAMLQQVSAIPTFILYRNGQRLDEMCGANTQLLEEKIKQCCDEYSEVDSSGSGCVDLEPFMIKTRCRALNEAVDRPLINCFQDNLSYLESDCNNQLIISIYFSQAVKINSLAIKAPETSGPKAIKFFTNQPDILNFDELSCNTPVESIEIDQSDLVSGKLVGLHYVKFQNIENIQLFVEDNHAGSDITRIDRLQLFGSPIANANIDDFKGITGITSNEDN